MQRSLSTGMTGGPTRHPRLRSGISGGGAGHGLLDTHDAVTGVYGMTAPVMPEASPLHRNRAAFATSSCVTLRFIGDRSE